MRIWVALLVAPVLALTDQTVAFALVHWACAHQSAWAVHLSHGIFLVLTLAASAAAWVEWRESAVAAGTRDATLQAHFLAGVAMTVAMLAAVAIVAMWIATWMISSCIA
jgi:hypothetical protein